MYEGCWGWANTLQNWWLQMRDMPLRGVGTNGQGMIFARMKRFVLPVAAVKDMYH